MLEINTSSWPGKVNDGPVRWTRSEVADFHKKMAAMQAAIAAAGLRGTNPASADEEPPLLGFSWEHETEPTTISSMLDGSAGFSWWTVTAPHWFFALITGATVLVCKPKPRLRFSLRDALVAMTLVGIATAAAVAPLQHVEVG